MVTVTPAQKAWNALLDNTCPVDGKPTTAEVELSADTWPAALDACPDGHWFPRDRNMELPDWDKMLDKLDEYGLLT